MLMFYSVSATSSLAAYGSCATEKFHPGGKRIMTETRFTVFPTSSVDPRLGVFSDWIGDSVVLFFLAIVGKIIVFIIIILLFS